jgi:hypothetical protein
VPPSLLESGNFMSEAAEQVREDCSKFHQSQCYLDMLGIYAYTFNL